MQVRNGVVAAGFVGLTIVVVHAGARGTEQPPAPGMLNPTPAGGGRQGRAAVFPAQQRPQGDPVVIERGKTLYSLSCSFC